MAELTLRDPLSGEEIIEIILQEIEQRLKGDSTLQRDLTYAGFGCRFQIDVHFARSLTKGTMAWGQMLHPQAEGVEVEPAGDAAIAGTYDAGPPNVERQKHDLPIPVLVQTPTGLERRKVKIERQGRKP